MKAPWDQSEQKMKEEGLVGWFFVTAVDGEICNQGRIEEMVSDAGYYRVTVFSWMSGAPSGSRIVSMDDIVRCFRLTGKTAEAHEEFCDNTDRVSLPDFQL